MLVSSQHNLYDLYLLLCMQYKTPDDRQRDSPKHVEFHFKNKSKKLVHLVGFVIRIYLYYFIFRNESKNLIFFGPCIIEIVEE